MKYRWEYRLNDEYEKEWFLYADSVHAPLVIESRADALAKLGPGHPLLPLLGAGPYRVEIRPYEPIVASRTTREALGRMFVNRVETKEENFKVWGLANGNVWLHTPGDSGR